jgi:para-nitrobenzyl esterase
MPNTPYQSLVLAALLFALNASGQDQVVRTAQGYIKGTIENGIAVFKGIPYAEPPVNARRYLPPIPHTPWTDTLNAQQFGPSARQPAGPKTMGSEDCLYLNLYTPKTDNQKRAVLLWVHGGSMTGGSGKGMNGHAFADNDNIVTITINYRLGAYGFLYLGDLDKKYSQSGNLGLLDVIRALQWVHENIAAFGGDPNRVTVMGESAGAKLLSAVMVSPASKGLFSQAILESGSVQCIRDILTAKNERGILLRQLGLKPNDAAKLLTLPADEVIKAQAKVTAGIGGNSFFGPVYDGLTIPEDAYQYVKKGTLSDIKAIIGTNENEGATFAPTNFSDADAEVFRPLFRDNEPMANTYYQTQLKTDSPYAALVKTMTQYMYQMHSYRFAKALTDAVTPVWVYRYKYQEEKEFGARHGDELRYIWGATRIESSTNNVDPAKKQLAKSLHGAWVSFIKTGDPNCESLPQWPGYSTTRKQIMVFDATDTVVALKEIYNDKEFPSAVFVIK